jgi:hypothetical protein
MISGKFGDEDELFFEIELWDAPGITDPRLLEEVGDLAFLSLSLFTLYLSVLDSYRAVL